MRAADCILLSEKHEGFFDSLSPTGIFPVGVFIIIQS